MQVAIDMWSLRRGDLTSLRASRSAAAYPGVPPAGAPRVSVNLTINGTYDLPPFHFWYADWTADVWRSTGLYAPPGQVITVTLRNGSAGVAMGLKVQVRA
jgi:hypothetical protein